MLQFWIHQASTLVPGCRNRQLRCQHQLVGLVFSVHWFSSDSTEQVGKLGKKSEKSMTFHYFPSLSITFHYLIPWNWELNPWKCAMSRDVPWALGWVQGIHFHGPMASLARAPAGWSSGVHVARGEIAADGIGMVTTWIIGMVSILITTTLRRIISGVLLVLGLRKL